MWVKLILGGQNITFNVEAQIIYAIHKQIYTVSVILKFYEVAIREKVKKKKKSLGGYL